MKFLSSSVCVLLLCTPVFGAQTPRAEELFRPPTVSDLEERLAADPGDETLTDLLAQFYEHDEQFDKAQQLLSKYLEKHESAVDTWILLSQLYGHAGKFDQALETVKHALQLFPKEPRLYLIEVGFYGIQKNYDKTMQAIEDGLKVSPNDEALLFSRIYAHETLLGDQQLALKELREFVASHPEFFKALEELATLETTLELFDASKKDWTGLIEKISKREMELGDIAVTKVMRKNNAMAGVRDAYSFMPLMQVKALALDRRGNAELELNQLNEAYEDAKQAVEMSPSIIDYRRDLGSVSFAKGELDEAESGLKQTLSPEYAEPQKYLELGYLYIAEAKYEESQEAFAKVIALGGDSIEYKYALFLKTLADRLLNQKGDESAALHQIKKALADKWPSPVVEYLKDDDEKKFLDAAGSDVGQQTEAHFVIALNEMAEKHNQKGKRNLDWIRKNGVPSFMETWTANAIKLK